ncbi:tRNA pseudouridine(55) synthase TruB [Noviherbaspirillum denitrificans]|uniref:tRNA pseudouridine synthase B n=1 Tax=Noviherbaspirillum denitrificans TaxID=1968433 RepID=A0A254T7I0_9BURK|nr:tRNA pseudouridine(55) synthase TruB [Noviherbaspirillum denitrificans]OWW18609.1 tRNA pseudouridine synthase B [Noviherbaspirillum denitrificans]
MAQSSPKKPRVPVDGVLLLDKAAGSSSNDVLIKAKRLLNAQKAGHTGTLDPFATGLLPLCFGEATKFSQDLLEADKTYEAVVHLGVTTTTGDTEGEVVQQKDVDATREQIDAAVAQFRGEIDQVPPMYSALKRDGKPLYEYARAGVVLEREARRVVIHALDVLGYEAPFLRLRVCCSKGTYIRVLGEDIGAALGCGAHLQALRRIQVGPLTLENALTLDTLAHIPDAEREQSLSPVDALLLTFPPLRLPEMLAKRFMHGQRIALGKEGLSYPSYQGRARVYADADGRLLGTAHLMEYGILAPERLIADRSGR